MSFNTDEDYPRLEFTRVRHICNGHSCMYREGDTECIPVSAPTLEAYEAAGVPLIIDYKGRTMRDIENNRQVHLDTYWSDVGKTIGTTVVGLALITIILILIFGG